LIKTRVIRNGIILCIIIGILFTNISVTSAPPEQGRNKSCLFNLQFIVCITWGNETHTPIRPGETREVNLTITYYITRGIYGKMILQILKGKTFPIRLSIEDKSDNCTAWIIPENITGIIEPDETQMNVSHLFIHLNEDAPGDYSLGIVRIRGVIEDKKGPFNILTLIQGYENNFTISFISGP